ncbi:hypothetical protein QOZ80_UnG0719800 [Eleusine coracana subsp. coracana]|uniref:Tf2-1-like SH3-like domain-containing protein n=1 Tax=Eleusine coracana subsp. coracana TaxID=191504 RepID=A0AAV9FYW5_ELECO|nr:hypothetical protein QOZ80_UnG0719800 [Eleusine coracana subsp. coracana]
MKRQEDKHRYERVFAVLARIGAVAYKLQLPASSSLHPVFHVSQLKCVKGVRAVSQVLIKWSATPQSLATWEDEEALRQQFPCAPAWGQASLQKVGSVTTTPVAEAENKQEQAAEPCQTVRLHKPNKKYSGPEWA